MKQEKKAKKAKLDKAIKHFQRNIFLLKCEIL